MDINRDRMDKNLYRIPTFELLQVGWSYDESTEVNRVAGNEDKLKRKGI